MTQEQRTELEGLFRNSKAGLSYQDTLREIAEDNPEIKRIFEWGPGASTLFLLDLFPEAKIYGAEHDPRWMEMCQKLMEYEPRVQITLERIDSPQKNGCYVTAPLCLGGKFDLIFVDGRLRRDCLGVAHLCLSEKGIVVLHDAEREAYHPAFQFYQTWDILENTAVLTPGRK